MHRSHAGRFPSFILVAHIPHCGGKRIDVKRARRD